MEIKAYIVFLLSSLQLQTAETLRCYTCHGSPSQSQCNTTTTCSDNQVCFLQTTQTPTGIVFELGCQDNQLCGGSGQSTGGDNLIGRNVHDYYKRQSTPNCHECCTREMCNLDLCSHLKPSACVDDETFDCAQLSSVLHICDDIDRAKTVCPKYCGLCNIVDGEWTPWSNWSPCDVTCGVGTRSRTRTCSNPPPANGGVDCNGTGSESQQCVKDACPIHGGWSKWSPWGECSATCDVGIERRDRSCSNPYPDKYGDHCFGDSRDDRICMSHPCTDGGWSTWQQWEACSVTCGGGLKRRHRSCDNPTPSAFGRSCMGTDEHTEICNNVHCQADTVAFHATNVNTSATLANVFIFRTVHLNEGNGYSNTSGRFTAPKQGLYFFTAHLCTNANAYVFFGIELILKNGTINHYGNTLSFENTDTNCGYTSALVRLNVNDHVAVSLTYGSVTDLYTNYYRDSYFTGILLST